MKNIVVLALYLCAFTNTSAQYHQKGKSTSTCTLNELSGNFEFTVSVYWAIHDFNLPFADSIKVLVIDKTGKRNIQPISVQSPFMAVIFDSFACDNHRSYFTGVNAGEEIIDNNWGNFIVRDFNFDNREDFAIKVADNNVGSLYAYYVQEDSGFRRSDYLSDNVGLMMDSFDSTTFQAYRSAPAGCCKMIHYTYQYNSHNQNWALVKTEEEDLTQE